MVEYCKQDGAVMRKELGFMGYWWVCPLCGRQRPVEKEEETNDR